MMTLEEGTKAIRLFSIATFGGTSDYPQDFTVVNTDTGKG
jgi:hypothetical protein